MLDIGMAAILLAAFATVIGFVRWCGKTADDPEGENE